MTEALHETDPQKRMVAAVGRIPSGLFIVTSCQGDHTTGILASWVQQCSFEPLQVSVAIQRNRAIAAWLVEGAPFVVNILDGTQTDMIVHFGRGFAPGVPAFSGLETEMSPSGPPILSESLAYLECTVAGRFPAGDHDIIVGRVVGGGVLGEGQPMIHVRKSGLHY